MSRPIGEGVDLVHGWRRGRSVRINPWPVKEREGYRPGPVEGRRSIYII